LPLRIGPTSGVGLLFNDFESPRRLRVNGTAQLAPAESVAPSMFVPHAGAVTPVPGWKRMDGARDLLPAGDRARDPDRS
jgi:hypothetical protein